MFKEPYFLTLPLCFLVAQAYDMAIKQVSVNSKVDRFVALNLCVFRKVSSII